MRLTLFCIYFQHELTKGLASLDILISWPVCRPRTVKLVMLCAVVLGGTAAVCRGKASPTDHQHTLALSLHNLRSLSASPASWAGALRGWTSTRPAWERGRAVKTTSFGGIQLQINSLGWNSVWGYWLMVFWSYLSCCSSPSGWKGNAQPSSCQRPCGFSLLGNYLNTF